VIESIREQFERFDAENPHVYEELMRLVLNAYDAGHRRIGIAMVYETMRYNILMRTLARDGFKLNNNYKIADFPQLDGVIETRELRAA
jgi:RNase H-fold protein (predicted Holliday junction resolvase)